MKKIFFEKNLLTGIADYILSLALDENDNMVIIFDDFVDVSNFKDIFLEYKEITLKNIIELKSPPQFFFLAQDDNKLDYESIIELFNFYKAMNNKFCLVLNRSILEQNLPSQFGPIIISKNEKINLDDLFLTLIRYGYRRREYVEKIGEFAVRGNIVDLWCNSVEYKDERTIFYRQPLRVVLNEDKIEDIKLLNASSQRSIMSEKFFKIEIFPLDLENVSSAKMRLMDILKKNNIIHFSNESNSAPLEGYFPTRVYYGGYEIFIRELKNFISEGYKIVVGYNNEYQLKKLKDLFMTNDIDNTPITYVETSLGKGFYNISKKFLFITYNEVFSKSDVFGLVKQPRVYESIRVENIWEIQPGDYVVHLEYGIGKFLGIKKITIRGITREFLALEFKEGALLYVPLSDIEQIEKYVSFTNKPPVLSSLSRETWEVTKRKIKESLKEFIIQLYEIYTQRKKLKGYQYKSDKELEEMFASTFEYEETEDQIRAIEDVFKDMSSEYPMDRVIVGDVGFGKTEVALRATFRAVINGKQVVVLCPTTVLAHQHFLTFSKRLEPFGVNVAVVSRLIPKSEIQKILSDLKKGKIDVIIGTHILLNDDIEFFDLGLVIIDEEHKFGVRQKEKIRLRYKQYNNLLDGTIPDVLYLTATPIPRTLAFGLKGIKDISLIEIPPQGRQPIETFVLPYSEDLIIYAINRELQRDGQVYYVFNDTQRIEYKAKKIKSYFNTANIEFIHSKLPSSRIEDIMIKFLNKQIDILVSTTIIEAGLDVPNVNTIIIENAHNFGLAQLYQLRGRVGRRDKKAYCYFLYSEDELTLNSKKRLSALMEFTSLGSGYQLALRDLEIRGAGEIIGTKQHGFINQVGLSMYSKIIQHLLYEVTTGTKYEEINPSVDISVDARIPDNYIKDENTRSSFYRRLLTVSSYNELEKIKEEMYDRFGKITGEDKDALENLFVIGYLKLFMRKHKIKKLYDEDFKDKKRIFIVFVNNESLKKFKDFKNVFSSNKENELFIEFEKNKFSMSSLLDKLLEIEKFLN